MKNSEYEKRESLYNKEYIEIGIGLNRIDNLNPSQKFYEIVNNSKTYEEAESKLKEYYENKDFDKQVHQGEMECDITSLRIANILENKPFRFIPLTLKNIHRDLFIDTILEQQYAKYIGKYRQYNIIKKESILNGNTIQYGDYSDIESLLEYDFNEEAKKDYSKMNKEEYVANISQFISRIWETHPFCEGNTRTIATFALKYLQNQGIECNNEMFKNKSLYFRNALVLSNYQDNKFDIKPDFSYLHSFFAKLIIDKNVELKKMPNNIYENRKA